MDLTLVHRDIPPEDVSGASGAKACDTDAVDDLSADFAAVARRWPTRAAVVHNGAATTYEELAANIHAAARRRHPNDLAGVLVSHNPAVVDHLLGALQARTPYCPIDASLPDARIEALIAVLRLERFLVAGQDLRGRTDRQIDMLCENIRSENTERPKCSQQHMDSAYVLCTSGSTGTPKPVAVSRQALSITVRALRDVFGLTPDDRVLQFASLSWDTCLEEMLPALTAGSALVFDDVAHCGSFPAFVRMLGQRDVTMLDLPTAFWHELVLFLHEEQAILPASVRLVVIGGERVDPTRLQQWRQLDRENVRLLNTYGCTETTMVTHAVQLGGPGTEPAILAEDVEAPIGRPLPHVCDHITDDGELLVSGPALASGYLGLPELTAAAFPVNDHGGGPERWFHTGDLVARGDNGLLYPRGRVDEQIKVRGVRVHPAEVEAQLRTHPAVVGAAVVGERRLGGAALTAYVVTARDATSAELKRHLRDRLPEQFVPTRVEFVEALAYTTSGKVDRAATRRAVVDSYRTGTDR